jgi:hypothetical protein
MGVMMSKKKNKSKTIKDGTIVQTNDRHLYSGRNYGGKFGEDPKKNNRPTVVVASNRKNELALVKITHSKQGQKLQDGFHKDKNSGFRPNVETKDNYGKKIRLGEKFEVNPKRSISKRDLRTMQKEVFSKSKYSQRNRSRVRKIKGRPP